jgi:hypothetical protein
LINFSRRLVSDRQRPHEIAKVARQGMRLQANRIGGEGTARQPGPLDRALALFDVLLAGAAVVVEGDDPLSRSGQVGDDEAGAWVQLARMPLDLGHDPARFLPALRLIGKPGVMPAHLMRRSPDWALQEMSSPVL